MGKLSPEREQELRIHLQTKSLVKYLPQEIDKIVQGINDIREEKVSLSDPFPNLEGIAKYGDWVEALDLIDFLIL